MELSYRGRRYQRSDFLLEGIEVQKDGIFRGTPYTISSFQTSQPATAAELRYRGTRYTR